MKPTCTYCGDPADARDHVIPQVMGFLQSDEYFNLVVPTCTSCNSHAGYNLFATVAERRRFIQKQIAKKHKKLLDTPDWTEGELEEMSWNMRALIEEVMKKKAWLKRRIAYNVEKSSDRAVIGSGTALRRAVKSIRRKISDV